MSISIRPATPADAPAITRVFLESARHHANIDPDRYFVPRAEEIETRYRTGTQHPDDTEAATLIAETGEGIAGFVDVRIVRATDAMHIPFAYCYIAEIAVEEDLRSRGIGAQLIHAAEDWGRAQGAYMASLEYNTANLRAAGLYQRLGYVPASIVAVKRL